jgi:Tol biopolymer transport system component
MKIFIYSLITVIILLVFNLNLVASSADERFEFDGKILFTAGQVKKNISHIYSLDGATRKVIQLTQKGRNHWPKWSPDGKKIAFVSIRDNHNNYDIYIMDADGKNQKRITNTQEGNSTQPRWDCSGSKIYFRRTIKGDVQENIIDLTTFEIHTLASTGKLSEVQPIKDINVYIEELRKKDKKELEKDLAKIKEDEKELKKMIQERDKVFVYIPSPNCRYYALHYRLPGKIKLLDIKTNELKELKSESAGTPAWTKDGKKLGYVNGENNDRVMIFDTDNNQYTEVSLIKKKEHFCRDELSWSSDSGKFAYTCGPDLIYINGSQIYILDLETRQAKAIINGHSPDWY